MLKIDSQFEHLFSFTQEDVVAFAKVTGDNNPVHLDEGYAANTMFKKPIMHGMLGATVFSKVFGTMFPGEGTIYLSQSLSFLKPMYVNEKYKAVFSVKELFLEKNRALFNTQIFNGEDKLVMTGEALVMNIEQIKG
jgi:acyl dehydratase